MTNNIYAIVAKVFSIPESQVNDQSSPENIDSWDSFNGLILVDELENHFNIKFSISEIIDVKTVSDIKRHLKNHNVELISVSEGFRSSRKEHQMVFEIMMSVAAYEKSIIKSRLSSGRKMKVKMGVRGFGGTLPLGYSKYSDGEIRPDGNSEIVKYIFKKMNQLNKRNLTKTKKTQTILKLLKNRNYTYKGKCFKKWNIKSILNNKFYIGEMSYGSITCNHNYDTLISTMD